MRFCLPITASLCLAAAAHGEDYLKPPPDQVAGAPMSKTPIGKKAAFLAAG